VWTPDGRALLYVSSRDGGRDIYSVPITRGGEPGSRSERITVGLGASAIDLASDGKTLAYTAYTAYAHIWSVPIPKTGAASLAQATQITTGGETVEGFALSADGRWLAYDSDRSGNGDIWKIATSGGQPVQLTTDPSGDYVQDWSSDGNEIAFHSFRTGQRQVFVMTKDGERIEQVTRGRGEAANPDFSPDANAIAFQYADGETEQVYVTTRARRGAGWGEPTALTTRGGTDPSWSPDGKWIAYVSNGIWIVSPKGGDARLVVPGPATADGLTPRFAYWSADGRTLYYKAYDARDASSIWSVALAGGVPRLLIKFSDPSKPSARREIATDGVRLYFTVSDPQSDVWLMTLRMK
jgi:Tol biopolymer transport system component